MAECLLELHPEKTKIVYCKDANRRGTYPVLRGWIQYYGRFHRSVLINVLRAIDYALVHWAQRKYKTLHGRKARAWAWLNGVRARQPGLFPHWSLEGG
nr:group II intron maturase-specific domain-containing protein [Cupriavidus sp. amp6]